MQPDMGDSSDLQVLKPAASPEMVSSLLPQEDFYTTAVVLAGEVLSRLHIDTC